MDKFNVPNHCQVSGLCKKWAHLQLSNKLGKPLGKLIDTNVEQKVDLDSS